MCDWSTLCEDWEGGRRAPVGPRQPLCWAAALPGVGSGHQEPGLQCESPVPTGGPPWWSLALLAGSAFLKVSNAFGCLGVGHMTFALLSRLCHLLFTRVTPPLPSVGWVGAGAVRQPRYATPCSQRCCQGSCVIGAGTQWLGGHALSPGPLLKPAAGWFSFCLR